ncbi:YdcF family protein [Pseudomonas duriflava]|nr:YdcF family protein [Pseudomonas duriflava]
MLFRYVVKQLVMPPGGLLLLIVIALLLRRRWPRLSLSCLALGLAGFWLMSLPVVVEWGATVIERDPPVAQADWPSLSRRADAIVILGAGRERADPAWEGDVASSLAAERVRYAARIARVTHLPVLITGGTPLVDPPSEAELMAEVMEEDYNVPVRWLEKESRTTWENATLSAPILKRDGVKRIVLVTQAFHMARAKRCFEQQGFEVIPAPMGFMSVPNGRPLGGWLPETKPLWQNGLLINEAIGLLLYPLAYR